MGVVVVEVYFGGVESSFFAWFDSTEPHEASAECSSLARPHDISHLLPIDSRDEIDLSSQIPAQLTYALGLSNVAQSVNDHQTEARLVSCWSYTSSNFTEIL